MNVEPRVMGWPCDMHSVIVIASSWPRHMEIGFWNVLLVMIILYWSRPRPQGSSVEITDLSMMVVSALLRSSSKVYEVVIIVAQN